MKLKYNIIAFIFIGTLGTLGHFFYEWSGQNPLIGSFFAVNESTWEHLKLLFFPTAIFSLAEYCFVKKEIRNYPASIAISLLAGMAAIVTIFYTYTGVLGKSIDFINIAIYYVALFVMLKVKNRIIENEKFGGKFATRFSVIICFVFALAFIIFTYNPPKIGIFTSP